MERLAPGQLVKFEAVGFGTMVQPSTTIWADAGAEVTTTVGMTRATPINRATPVSRRRRLVMTHPDHSYARHTTTFWAIESSDVRGKDSDQPQRSISFWMSPKCLLKVSIRLIGVMSHLDMTASKWGTPHLTDVLSRRDPHCA